MCWELKISSRHKIGSWVEAHGDVIQTPRRNQMEKKFLAIIAVSLRGHHFYKVMNANQSVDSVIYVDVLTQLEHFL